ncbi:MAG TPA: hypothetical protein VN805_08480 [Caulobacteraceae bacterium]|nr:hypothetical protein [Caulobacteraceae bacterium]
MKLNAIASAIALACLVTGTTVALATPHVADATSTGKITKVTKTTKTSKAHKGGKRPPHITGGYG